MKSKTLAKSTTKRSKFEQIVDRIIQAGDNDDMADPRFAAGVRYMFTSEWYYAIILKFNG